MPEPKTISTTSPQTNLSQKELSPGAWAQLLLLGCIWGASFFSIRIAINEIPVLTSVLHRTFWAMLILWCVVFVSRLPVPLCPRMWFYFLIMGLMNNSIPFCLMAWAQLHVKTGLTSILNASTAIFSIIAAALFFADERLTLHKTIGVSLGFVGVVAVIGFDSLHALNTESLAQFAIIAGTISYALASVWARLKLTGLAPQVAAAGMLTMASLSILPIALYVDGPIRFDLKWVTWFAIGYYSAIATAGAYLLYYRVLAKAGSGNLMLVTLIIPPIAILLGRMFLDERLQSTAFLGFALLSIGLLVLDGQVIRKLRSR